MKGHINDSIWRQGASGTASDPRQVPRQECEI